MEKVVIDTSVAIKWFVDEPFSDKAKLLLERFRNKKITILAPDIILLEIINGLFFSYKLTLPQLKTVIKGFYLLGLSVKPISVSLITKACKIMDKFEIASYDALFIALANKEGYPLITADKKHHQKKFYKKIIYLDEVA